MITPALSSYCTTAGSIWDSNWDKEAGYQSMLGVTLNETESAEYTPMINDITTYITETCVQFVNGSKPLSEFDSYREQLKNMGIERCIELYQAAFERYMAR
jgi:putative aldouronate transport system substrate-binding protein